jgi:hypothetical protein
MRHVDEGTIHAWLDQQVTDPQEVARITAHLRECATCNARVAEEEATIRDAEALLSSVAPYADGSREAFEALVAGAGQRHGAADHAPSGSTSRKSGPSYPWWLVFAGWAATIALAIGIGWSARYLMSPRSPVEKPAASPVPHQMARAEAPPVQPSDGREQGITPDEPTARAARPSRTARARPQPSAAAEERVRSAPPASQGDAPAPTDSTGQKPVELETARSLSSLIALVPGAPTPAPPPQAAPPFSLPFRSETVEVTAEAPVVDVQNARQRSTFSGSPATAEAPVDLTTSAASASQPAPAPPAVAPAAGGGRGGRGGGGGGGGGRGGGRAAGTPPVTAGAVDQFAAGATENLNQGRLLTDGLPINGTERADGIEWVVLPREAARERSRMSLYGIDGLTPARTMVNADGSKVRTVYVVNAAEVVLLQERQPAQDTSLERSIPAQGSATANMTPTFRTGASVAAAADPQSAQAAPARWSATRGDVVLTVQGTDAAGFGARVRLD